MNTTKNILITGASTGIGYATAAKFVKEGFYVYGSLRNQADADRLSRELGSAFHPLIFDVTDHGALEETAGQLEASLKGTGLRCLINNAGVAVSGPLLELPIEEVRHQLEVNFFGLLKATQAFAPLLGARKNHPVEPGKIINISSVSGKIGFPLLGPYVASKHAVEGLSEVLRKELMIYGIDVVVVGPGSVKTPIWSKGLEMDTTRYEHSDYANAMQKMGKLASDAHREGLPAQKLADLLFRIATTSKTKTHYRPVARKFTRWTLPRMLPTRLVDKSMAKMTGLDQRKTD